MALVVYKYLLYFHKLGRYIIVETKRLLRCMYLSKKMLDLQQFDVQGCQKYWHGISNGWGVNMVKAMPIKLFVVIY